MSITRPRIAADNYTIITNAVLRSGDLTPADKGLLAYILSHAAGYELTVEQILAENAIGDRALNTILTRLERKGYLKRTRRRAADGRLGTYDWDVTIDPDGNPIGDEPDTTSAFATLANRRLAATSGNATSPQAGTTMRFARVANRRVNKKNNKPKKTTEEDQSGPTTSDRAGDDDALFPGPDPAEESQTDTAWRIARAWIDRYTAARGPVIAKGNADPAMAIKNVALAALKAGCTEAVIKVAFDDVGEAIPSIAQINRAIGLRRANGPTNGVPRQPQNLYRNPGPAPDDDPFPVASRSSDYDEAATP